MKNQKNVVICPLVGEQSLAPEGFDPGVAVVTKEGKNRNKSLWPLLPRLTAVLPPQGREMFRGFTLIELLVVVLIIGILAAVAVPQYQKAVLKSRFATVKEMAQSLANAEELYYLANGEYTIDFEALDINPPLSEEEETDETTYSLRIFKDWQCRIYQGTTDSYASCGLHKDGNGIMSYQVYMQHGTVDYVGQRWCVSASTDLTSLTNQICKSETKQENPSNKYSGATWTVWVY